MRFDVECRESSQAREVPPAESSLINDSLSLIDTRTDTRKRQPGLVRVSERIPCKAEGRPRTASKMFREI